MAELKVLYRDVDRTPYLFTMRHCARQYGLDVELVRAPLGVAESEWGGRLEREEVDAIGENYWGLVSYRARGVPFLTLTAASTYWTEKLLAQPSVRSIEELRGEKMAVRTPGPQELFPAMWLEDMGLAQDVSQVVYSDRDVGRWGQWKKVAEGECAATFVTYIYADAPLAAGLHELPYERFDFVGGNVTLTTSESIIARKRQDLQHLVTAAFDTCRLFKSDPATVLRIMRDECLELLCEHLNLPDDQSLDTLYRMLRDELSDVPVPSAQGIANAHRMQLATAPHLKDFNPLLMWDFNFAREALRTAQTSAARA
jgi:hypothetical protein